MCLTKLERTLKTEGVVVIVPKGGKREGAGRKARTLSSTTMRGVRFTDAEWEAIKRLAEQQNQTPSEYIRRKALS